MNYKINNFKGNSYITIDRLSELGLIHCFTTSDMNMRLASVDRNNGTIDNYYKVFDFLNIEPKQIYMSKQNHTNNIQKIDHYNQGKDFLLGRIFNNNDGFITDKKDIVLTSSFADCTPILLFDPIKKVHANIHSGWKGTLQRIISKGINMMIKYYDSSPENIIVVLGPSIGRDDFQVESDVKELFQSEFPEYTDIIRRQNSKKFLIDLDKININMALDNNIKEDNIIIIDLSTYSNDLFHSYRRDGKNYQIMSGFTYISE